MTGTQAANLDQENQISEGPRGSCGTGVLTKDCRLLYG